MLGKITLIVVGFVSLTTGQESIFSLYKKQQKPSKPIKYKPPKVKVDGDVERWRGQTNRQFENCDSNRSGFITRAEYSMCSPYMNNWDELVAQYDANSDGMLNWSEVYQAVRQADDHSLALVEEADLEDAQVDE